MKPTAVIVAALAGMLAAGMLAVVPAAAVLAQPREVLRAEVGPAFSISLRHADGSAVTQLDAGEYAVAVDDRAIEHNFHLFGLGVNQATAVETTGTVTWTVNFTDAQIYRYQCDPHSLSLRGSFRVGNPPTPPPPAPKPGRLGARVTAGAISVTTASGSRAKTVRRGAYRMTVRDTSRAQNFHLTGPGVNRKTGIKAKQTATWTLNLKAGRYSYRSDGSRKLRGSFRVT